MCARLAGTQMSDTCDGQNPPKSSLLDPRLLLLISAGGLVPAVLAIFQEYVQARHAGRAPRWQDLVFSAGDWLFLAVLTPIPSYFGTRFQFRPRRRTLAFAAHVVGAAAFCLIWSAFGLGLGWLLHRYPAVGPLWPAYLNWALIATPFSVLIYLGVLGCVYAFSYFAQIQEREAYAERLAAQLAEARLGALRMQLNPHFLFNSLNALSVLVRERNISGSLRMLELLSDVLHQVLSADQRQQILLADELKFLEQYFAIEQVRFSDRLRVNWNIDERARLAYVPSFLLQPLVENAIKHGITKRADAGRIDISALVLGDRLELSVRDDGVGVKSSYAEGVGLSNTRERLRTLYGNDGSLTITPTAEGGTEAILHIPFRAKTP
jgi:two-component system, LytTR family, sensor kinase